MKKINRKIKEKFKKIKNKYNNWTDKINQLKKDIKDKKVEINLGPNQRRLGSLILGLGIVGAVFGLSVVPVFAKEAAPKPAPGPAPSLDNENSAKVLDVASGVAAAVCAGAIHTGFFGLGVICGLVVVGGMIYRNSN